MELLFFCIVQHQLHEMGHYLSARMLGANPIYAIITVRVDASTARRKKKIIAAAGPLSNIIGFLVAYIYFDIELQYALIVLAGAFELIPVKIRGFKTDGWYVFKT